MSTRSHLDQRYMLTVFAILVVGSAMFIAAYSLFQATVREPTQVEFIVSGTPIPDMALEQQVALQKYQLEQSITYTDRLVQIVVWSLSGLVASAGLVIGANLFSSYRATQQERSSLAKAEEDVVRLQSDLRKMQSSYFEFVVDDALRRASQHTADKEYAKAILVICRVCEGVSLSMLSSHQAQQLASRITGILRPLRNPDSELFLPEKEQLLQLRTPVIAIAEHHQIEKEALLALIETIAEQPRREDTLEESQIANPTQASTQQPIMKRKANRLLRGNRPIRKE